MNIKQYPGVIAATIAGGGIGMSAGAMTRGERSEEYGDSGLQQTGQFLYGGITGGIVGTGIGVGIGGTAYALKHILRK